VRSSIDSVLNADGNAILKPVREEVMRLTGESTVCKAFSVTNLAKSQFDELSKKLNADVFLAAAKWCQETGALQLQLQISYLHRLCNFAISIAKGYASIAAICDLPLGKSLTGPEHIQAVKDIVSAGSSFKAIIEKHADPFDVEIEGLNMLQGLIRPQSVNTCLLDDCRTTLLKFSTKWTYILNTLSSAIEGACPAWLPFRNAILCHPGIISALTENPKYTSIGTLSRTLKDQRSLVRGCNGLESGPLVSAQTLKRAQEAMDMGTETVAMTFTMFRITKQWVKIDNVPELLAVLTQLRADLAPTKVNLPEQVEDLLKTLKAGECLGIHIPAYMERLQQEVEKEREQATKGHGSAAGSADEAVTTQLPLISSRSLCISILHLLIVFVKQYDNNDLYTGMRGTV